MKRIRILRKERGINQQRLAAELNVTQAMISKYELGLSEPDIETICRIAEFFGVSSDYLLEISDEKISISSYGLSDMEKEILFGFKRLDGIQKAKLQAYLQGLLQE
ncbi:MAG: helix-turn-helix domain-containing protein [Oscillospiraceae bacterium]|nr:helix-turn-helix domain-containing protein [Oscillospiraceae bacterium]